MDETLNLLIKEEKKKIENKLLDNVRRNIST